MYKISYIIATCLEGMITNQSSVATIQSFADAETVFTRWLGRQDDKFAGYLKTELAIYFEDGSILQVRCNVCSETVADLEQTLKNELAFAGGSSPYGLPAWMSETVSKDQYDDLRKKIYPMPDEFYRARLPEFVPQDAVPWSLPHKNIARLFNYFEQCGWYVSEDRKCVSLLKPTRRKLDAIEMLQYARLAGMLEQANHITPIFGEHANNDGMPIVIGWKVR